MKTYYQEILNDFHDDEEIKSAVLLNNTLIYKYFSWIIMQNSTEYKGITHKKSNRAADQLLMDTLIIFRRQVKNELIGLLSRKDKIYAGNIGELAEYLTGLYQLIYEISPLNPFHQASADFEKELKRGRGFSMLNQLNPKIFGTLHEAGCRNAEDKQDILNESLVIFWKKLLEGELGLYFTGNPENPGYCCVYNRKLYRHSKLSTFLSGIARNIFLNMTRTAEFRAEKSEASMVPDSGWHDPFLEENDLQVETMFLYYRNYVEPRKLRTVISLLQYDCNLEDREVRQLIGINNARIHSSRQRSHFMDWYEQNLNNAPAIFDASHDYFLRRENKRTRLNEKIRTIDQFDRNKINHVDLEKFREEFRSNPEFRQHYRIFKHVYYFVSTGKQSGLSGLPDEKSLRAMMDAYKEVIFGLPNYQAVLFLLFYGADEPDETIISLLKGLHPELAELEQDSDPLKQLLDQLGEHHPANNQDLTNEVYASNCSLFAGLSVKDNFINMVN